MQMQMLRRQILAFLTGLAMLACSTMAVADPPSRVARLGYLSGTVSFSPAGESDWVKAAINRPLSPGDRLWTDGDSVARAEIQVGGAMIRMDHGTSVAILNLDDRIAQLQVTQGSLNIRVWRLEPDQVFEVDTPNLAFSLRQPGQYRIDIDPENNTTSIIVREGKGEAWGEDAAYMIEAQQSYRFSGTGLHDYQPVSVQRLDDFDRWANNRDRSYDNSRSARYVSSDVVGYQDLDANGSWRVDPDYGNVWVPHRLAANWAPYSDGHWAWIDPWGWTWIDDAPWGFAVSHYGRWAHLRGAWSWVPGPQRSRAYYAPALVAFVGGNNVQLSISGGNAGAVAWFPLAPKEVYRPSYPASRRYFENINQSNTVINNISINNHYNNTNVNHDEYANRKIAGAVVAVPTAAFVQSQTVSRVAQRPSREVIAGRPVLVVPRLAPTEKSVRGAAVQGDKPPARVFERPVIARTALPAAHPGFASQHEQLTAKPGMPLDDKERKALKSGPGPVPVVKLVKPDSPVPGSLRSPPQAAAERPGQDRAKIEEQKGNDTPAIARPDAPVQGIAPVPGTPPEQPKAVVKAPATARQTDLKEPAATSPAARGKTAPREEVLVPSQRPPEARALPPIAAPEPRKQQVPKPRESTPRHVAPPVQREVEPPPIGVPEKPVVPREQRAAPPKELVPEAARPARSTEPSSVPPPSPRPERPVSASDAPPTPVLATPAATKQVPPVAEPRGHQGQAAAGRQNDRPKDGNEDKRKQDR